VAQDGIEIMRQFVASSPFAVHVGLSLLAIETDHAEISLPYSDHVVTIGETVHGGAIASLIDVAATAAAWAGAGVPQNMRGTTVGLTVTYVAAANKTDLTARAHVLRRGKSLSYVDVEVSNSEGELVAKGLVTYKLG
jgi:uncharacterized protein (TIGR00369 family)